VAPKAGAAPEDPHSSFMLVDENTFQPILNGPGDFKYAQCLDFSAIQKTSNGGYIFIGLCDTENSVSKLSLVFNDELKMNVPTHTAMYDAKLDARYDQIQSHSLGDDSLMLFLRNADTNTLEIYVVALGAQKPN